MSKTDPKRHIQKARNSASGYAFSNVIKSEPFIDALITIFSARMSSLTTSHTSIALDFWFAAYAFDVVGEVTFSRSFGFLASGTDIGGTIANNKILGLYICILGHFPWLHEWLLGNPLIERLGLAPTSHVFETCLAAVEARSKSDSVRRDMMQQWRETRERYPKRMEEREVLASAVANMGATGETVSAGLQALFYHLLRDGRAFKSLRAEIDAAQQEGKLSEVVSNEQATKLPYLQACLKEALRIHSPVAYGLPRIVPEGGLTVAGRTFEAGLTLSVNPWVMHRQDVFGDDVDIFNPDRWMHSAERTREMERAFIPFGAGYNSCPGRPFAWMEMSKLAATSVRVFDFELVDPGTEWGFRTHFTNPLYGWPCRVRRREM